MLKAPAAEWDVIDGEAATVQGLFTGYVAILSAIPAIIAILAGLVLASMFSAMHLALGGMSHLVGPVAVVGGAVLNYIAGLVSVFAGGYIVSALAPSFDGQKNDLQGMKLVAYTPTAAWVSSLLLIIPVLGFIGVLAGAIYSLYAFWLGAPKLMKVPSEKAAGFAIVTLIAWIVAAIVIGMVFGMLRAALFMGSMLGGF